ncbi:MAG TPA: alpha/beta hydrolase [Blastocatellia bacterium]|jgi:pimeloyl-ACP methyl ester carboxylesterase|nr:alpha/beta hydrolase [Blastocatellia bacterium]
MRQKIEPAEHIVKDPQEAADRTLAAAYRPQPAVAGSGPLLVYIAGLDGTGQLFFKQAPSLSQSYRVATYRSRDEGKFTYDDLTADVAYVIRSLGEERATVLGESFGGTVALAFALRYPEMVERLVVVNSFPRFRSRIRIRLAALLASVLPFQALWPVRLAANTLGLYADGVEREDRRRFFKAIRTVKGESYARRLQLISEFDVEDRLPEIQAPTLFIAGEKDRLIESASEARDMAARMPDARVRIVEGAGHACLLGNRVRLAEILSE